MRPVAGWGRDYLVIGMPNGYGNAMGEQVLGERVTGSGSVAKAWRERLGPWLFVSDGPTSMAWLGQPVTVLSTIPGLPGYLDVGGLSPVDARDPRIGSMFLQVPLVMGRDLDDLVTEGRDRLRMGTSVMVAMDSVPDLAPGASTVRVGRQGYGEWRQIDDASRVAVRGAEAWFLYSEGVELLTRGTKDAAGVKAPQGSLLLVFGDPGDVVDVRVSTR
jgi:hypothetical protein